MKRYILALLIMICALNIPLLGQFDTRQFYEHKVNTYSGLEKTGWFMAGFGGCVSIVGITLLSNVNWTSNDDNYNNYSNKTYTADKDQTGKVIGGIVCLVAGVSMLSTGIVLGSIGSHKKKKYKAFIDNLAFDLKCTPQKQGFVLTYRF